MSYVDAALEYALAAAPEYPLTPVTPVSLPRPRYWTRHTETYNSALYRKQPNVHAQYEVASGPWSSPRVLRRNSPLCCTAVPVSCVWQPFQEPTPSLPIQEFSKWRCRYCKAYLNPGFDIRNSEFLCNLCGNTQETPPNMPEVDIGTYEIQAPSDYGEPFPLRTVCLTDCRDAMRLPVLQSTLKSVLKSVNSEVCVMSFSRLVTFYCPNGTVYKVEGETPPWTPVPTDLLFSSVQEAEWVSEKLETEGGDLEPIAAIKFAGKVLQGHGRLILIYSNSICLPSLPDLLEHIQLDVVLCDKPVPELYSHWMSLCRSTGGRVYTQPPLLAPYCTDALMRVRSSEHLQLQLISGPGRARKDGVWMVAALEESSCFALRFNLNSR